MKPTVLDLFSGCGGFSLGFQQAGYEIVGFVEMWKPAIETYKRNHPNVTHIGYDITQIPDEVIKTYEGKIDVIIGGPPCQGFSMAGKRNPHDQRNQLYKYYLRFVKIIKPKTVIMENVVGILSMKNAEGERIIAQIVNDLIQLGYFVCYKKLNAADYNVPQNRQRIIIIGKKLDLYPKPSLPKQNALNAIKDLPEHEDANINGHSIFHPREQTNERIRRLQPGEKIVQGYNFSRQRLHPDKPSPTVSTKPLFIHQSYNRFLTPREFARLQSFPDTFLFHGTKTSMVKQIGNAVPPTLAREIANKLISTS